MSLLVLHYSTRMAGRFVLHPTAIHFVSRDIYGLVLFTVVCMQSVSRVDQKTLSLTLFVGLSFLLPFGLYMCMHNGSSYIYTCIWWLVTRKKTIWRKQSIESHPSSPQQHKKKEREPTLVFGLGAICVTWESEDLFRLINGSSILNITLIGFSC